MTIAADDTPVACEGEALQQSAMPRESGVLATVFRNSLWSTFAVVAAPILMFLFGGLTLRYVGIEATGFSLAVGAVLAFVTPAVTSAAPVRGVFSGKLVMSAPIETSMPSN